MPVLIKHCPKCHEHTLKPSCPACGSPTVPDAPAKYSPEDPYGKYRRDLKRLVAKDGLGKKE